jgi:hypothetical protein
METICECGAPVSVIVRTLGYYDDSHVPASKLIMTLIAGHVEVESLKRDRLGTPSGRFNLSLI